MSEGTGRRKQRGPRPLAPWVEALARVEILQEGLSVREYAALVGKSRQAVHEMRKEHRYQVRLAELRGETPGYESLAERLTREATARAAEAAAEAARVAARERELAAAKAEAAFNLAAEVMRREQAAWERKVQLMEQDTNLSVANQAVDWVLNRRLPETRPAEERTVHVRVSVEERARLGGILQEAIEVEALPAPEEE